MSVSGSDVLICRLASLVPIRLHGDVSDIVYACELKVVRIGVSGRWCMVQSSFHLFVGALADLLSPDPDIDEDVGDGGGGRNDGESKEGLVDVADSDAGVVAPVGDGAGVEEGAGHVVAQKAHSNQP